MESSNIIYIPCFYLESKTDLESAKDLLKTKRYSRVIFHCQQCCEKIIKAVLASRGKNIIFTHEITPFLLKTLTEDEIKELEKVIRYSSSLDMEFPKTRYPIPAGDDELFIPSRDYTKEDAEEYLKKAVYLFQELKKLIEDTTGLKLG